MDQRTLEKRLYEEFYTKSYIPHDKEEYSNDEYLKARRFMAYLTGRNMRSEFDL